MNQEILIIDKPKGLTSFGIIRELRKKLGIKKIGHAGTLDPLATGVMILGVGKGTKLLTNLVKLDKTYEAEVLLGQKTTTGDLEGEVISEVSVCHPERSVAKSKDLILRADTNLQNCISISQIEIQKVLESLIGEIELQVPRFSAIKVKGQKLYDKARKGQDFEPPTRIMKIYSILFHDLRFEDNKAYLKITLDVGSGTYIRSIAEEIGNRLGVPATLSDLRRTRVGKYGIDEARKLDDF
jgi:tRNA pseudouridine55 synthase